jgi:hypothetical protein
MIVAEVLAEVHLEKAMIEDIQGVQDIPTSTIHKDPIMMVKDVHISNTPVSEEEILKTNNLTTREATV